MAKNWSANQRLPKMLILNCHTTINFLDKLEDARWLSDLELQLRVAVKLSLHRLNAAIADYWSLEATSKK